MALINPHPALKVCVPMNPMVDGWMGDDWFHFGAFRQQNMQYIYEQVASRDNIIKWWSSYHDDYDLFLQAGFARGLGRRPCKQQIRLLKRILGHTAFQCLLSHPAVAQPPAPPPITHPA